MAYVYKDPLKRGYEKVYLSKQDHNALFKHRKRDWKYRYEYYLSQDEMLMYKFSSLLAKIINTVLLPLAFLVYGLYNWREIVKDTKSMFNEKKYGAFTSDVVRGQMLEEVLSKIKYL